MQPIACVAAVAQWYDPTRLDYLVTTVAALRQQAPDGACAIVTNELIRLADDLRATALASEGAAVRQVNLDDAPAFLLEPGHRIPVVPWGHRHHPFRLPWFRKRVFHRSPPGTTRSPRGVSHLVYLEDDLGLAERALDCWRSFRRLLARFGLLPAFTRIEGSPAPSFLTT